MKPRLYSLCAGLTALAITLTLSVPACPVYADEENIPAATEVAPLPEPSIPEAIPTETVPSESLPAETIPTETVVPEQTVSQEAAITAPVSPVPLFYQTDYPNVLYSNGTIATDGCSVTCLAMVATYLTHHPYLPDELAGYFGGYLEGVMSNLDRLEAASTALQLPWRRATDFHDAIQALRSGKVVIAMMNNKSIFTDSQHFIVWSCQTDDGKILVNDPYAPNYEQWNLKNAFVYGFEEGDLCAGFSGGWIFDPDAVPEKPFIYHKEKVVVECRYPDVTLTAAEQTLLARMVWVEARGECAEGQQAVAEVVLNRLVSDRYSDNIRDIIYSDNQFRSTKWLDEAEPTQAQYDAVQAALNGPYVLPIEVTHFATYAVTDRVWGTIGGHIFCYPPSQTNN